MRLCRLALIAALGLSMSSCTDSGSDNSRLERRLDELVKELRQSRAEAQRGAERMVALLQTISATASACRMHQAQSAWTLLQREAPAWKLRARFNRRRPQ